MLTYFAFACLISSVLARKDVLTMDGDIILGGLFPIHKIGSNEKECGLFNEIPGYQYMEAMLYAIDKINRRRGILPGIKLGTIIYDTCRSPTITADKTKEFIKITLMPSTGNNSEFAGVIGAFKSGNSVIAANFLRVFRIPQISYGSLTVQLSNKDVYDYFFRTVPPDSFFAEALVVLLKRMGWTYVSVVYSKGTWAETGAQEVMKALRREKICFSKFQELSRFPKAEEFNKTIELLTSDDNQPSVVILQTIQRDSHGLLKAKKRYARAGRLTFVGSLEWSNRRDITKGLGEVADGTIAFGHREGQTLEFKKYFEGLRFKNYSRNNNEWIGEYWQETNKCRLRNVSVKTNFTKECTGEESNTRYKELGPVQVVINAIEAMANALHTMHTRLCPGTTEICNKMRPLNRTLLLEFLRNVTFVDAAFHFPVHFNAKQEVDGNYTLFNFRRNKDSFDYVQVGSWVSKLYSNGSIIGNLELNQSNVRWAKGSRTTPVSTCKMDCRRNEISALREDKCCWDCRACADNDVIVNNTCQSCAEGFVPNENLTECSKLALKYVDFGSPLSVFISFVSCLGIATDAFVFAVFVKNRENRLIKASGREMCYFMFAGICAIFMVPLTSLPKPTRGLCYFRRFIAGISFTVVYASLLMKMWRIHRIFRTANQLRKVKPTGLVGRRSLLAITFGLIAVQGLFCALVFSTDPPEPIEKFYHRHGELVLECSFKRFAFFIYFCYNIILLLCCTFYAFITRHFPKNFNEAMYIGITMYLTCATWIVFFATFLNEDYSISRVYWASGCTLVIGWITLLGLFAPKLYQLFTKTEFNREMLLTWGESSFPRVESALEISGQCARCKMRYTEAETDKKNAPHELPQNGRKDLGFPNPASD